MRDIGYAIEGAHKGAATDRCPLGVEPTSSPCASGKHLAARACGAARAYPVRPLIFVSVQFTNLLLPELLSLGFAALEPATEFYVELDPDSPVGRDRMRRMGEGVRYRGALAQWGRVPGASVTSDEMGRRAGSWLMELAQRPQGGVAVCFDHPTAFELTVSALREAGLWERLCRLLVPIDVSACTRSTPSQIAVEKWYRMMSRARGIGTRHALAQAQALRASYMAVAVPCARLERFAKTRSYQALLEAAMADADHDRLGAVTAALHNWLLKPPSVTRPAPLDVLDSPGRPEQILRILLDAVTRGEHLR